jgi:hypothetical protein
MVVADMIPPQLGFTASAVAKLCGVSTDTIQLRCRDGSIRARKLGKLWIISRREMLRICGEDSPWDNEPIASTPTELHK